MPTFTAKNEIDEKQIIIVVFNNFNLLDGSGPIQVFTEANHVNSNTSTRYKATFASTKGGLIMSNSGVSLDTTSLNCVFPSRADTIIIAGGNGVHRSLDDEALVNWIKKNFNKSCRIGSVCTGAFLLAQSGLLDGKKAVTHWQSIDQLQASFPKVQVEHDSIYIFDQGIWSSAGISAGIDLALAMLMEDVGYQVSLETARALVVYMKRPGGQSQYSVPLNAQMTDKQGVFNDLHVWVIDNLNTDLSVERLADYMNTSPRTFYRLYKKTMGITPAKSVEKMRIELTKEKLEKNKMTISTIARQCGFQNEERMRRSFVRHFGISPSEYQKRFTF